jgi:hypothetical protein
MKSRHSRRTVRWLPTGKDAESEEAQEHANTSSLALYA